MSKTAIDKMFHKMERKKLPFSKSQFTLFKCNYRCNNIIFNTYIYSTTRKNTIRVSRIQK